MKQRWEKACGCGGTVQLLLQAFMAAWAVMIATGMTVRNVLTAVIFMLLSVFFCMQERTAYGEKKIRRSERLCAALFALLTVLAQHKVYEKQFSSEMFQVLTLLIAAAGLYFLALHVLRFLTGTYFLSKVEAFCYRPAEEKHILPEAAARITGVMAICLLCWLPYFLYEYPGIMSPDSMNQFEQVVGISPWSNHHPVAHTLCISLFYHIGRLFTDNVNAALSVYTVAQMVFMAFCAGMVVRTLGETGIRRRVRLLIVVFYALVPFNAVFAVTIWKDVPFAGIFMLFGCVLLRLLRDQNAGHIKLWAALYFSGCAMCLFRSNGWYCFLLLTPFLLYAFRRNLRRVLTVCGLVILTAGIIKGPVMTAAGITQPDFIESCSVPLQQIARVVVDSKPLTDGQDTLIHQVIDTTYIKQLYAADFADNMKELVRAGHEDYLTAHKAQYFRLWLALGVRYPGTYLEAWAELTKGFWFPDVSYETGNIDGVITNSAGVTATPLIAGPVVIKGKEILRKLGDFIPLYGLFFSMGTYTWLLLLSALTIWKRRACRRQLLQLLPSLCLLFTLLIATPVATEFRYAYPVVMTMPLWILGGGCMNFRDVVQQEK